MASCKELFDSVFTYQSECDGGLSTANSLLIAVVAVVVAVIAAVAVFSRLYARRHNNQNTNNSKLQTLSAYRGPRPAWRRRGDR